MVEFSPGYPTWLEIFLRIRLQICLWMTLSVGGEQVGMSAPFNVEGEWNHQECAPLTPIPAP